MDSQYAEHLPYLVQTTEKSQSRGSAHWVGNRFEERQFGERPLAHCNLCEEMLYTADSHFLRMASSTAQIVPVSELDWDIRVQGRQSSLTPITLMSNGPSDWLRLLES